MAQNDEGVFKGQIRTTPEEAASIDLLKEIFEDQTNLPEGSIAWLRILRKSIDARKRPVKLQLTVEAGYADTVHLHS